MNYVLIGVLFGIGFYAVGIVLDILGEIIQCRLHKSSIYKKICKVETDKLKKEKIPMGFHPNDTK